MLLIGLSLNDGFVLPGDQVKKWYGISSSTLTKGLGGLRKSGLLAVKRDFGPKGRRAARGERS